ncbi:MAG: N-acetylglutaminylglutamine amidotransferase [Gammaproteobacteria bacterium]|nr:MAG: N-acetylglutaminylglutamine amidotransferase [Gammaproteobacteria bacterium]
MLAVLVPRGPDDEGKYFDGGLGLGHRRLSIIDLSERSHQPMVDKNAGVSLVFNGTIYNYRELRQQLIRKGHAFFSDGDTEVILRSWLEWGEDCVTQFSGMFAFALWDSNARKLFLARDRLGIKPLYYSRTANALRFASNPQALLAAGNVDTRIDPVALHHHFHLHAVVPAPRTVLRGVRKLSPATTMSIDASGKTRLNRYWDYPARRPDVAMTEDEWLDAVHDALTAAVERRRLASDVPVGVLLSGGLDSSLLVALLCEAGVTNLKTFSVGFEDMPEEKGNEFEYSDQVVDRYQTEHYKFHIHNEDVIRRLPEAITHMAEPMVGQDAIAFYLLSEQVSREVKVVQSGQGADEVFGGYFWYPKMQQASGPEVERFRQNYFDRDHNEYLAMVQPALHGPDYTEAKISALLKNADADDYIDKVLHLDVTTLIVDDPVKRVDNMTMAWGLEARVPFLDHSLVELAARMPAELKLASGGKHILKRIARGRVPDGVIDRPKGYFPVPALKYVRGEFLDFMKDILNSAACRHRGLYQRGYVEHLLAAPDRHFTRILGSKLWHLALLEYWLQQNVDGA